MSPPRVRVQSFYPKTEMGAVQTFEGCCAMSSLGDKTLVVPMNVIEQFQCARLIEKTVALKGRIHIWVNNAGIIMPVRFDEIKDLGLI